MKYIFLFISLLLGSFHLSIAQSTQSLEFLTIGADANQLAYGEGTTARVINPFSALANPALLDQLQHSELTANFTNWIVDTNISSVATVLKRDSDTFGFSIVSNTTGDVEARTAPGPSTGTFSIDYLSLNGSYARSFFGISMGIGLSYINERYLSENASGYAVNLGLSKSLYKDLINVGTSIINLGRMSELLAERSALPTQWKTGVHAQVLSISTTLLDDQPILVSFSSDVSVPLSSIDSDENVQGISTQFIQGIDLSLGDIISVISSVRLGENIRRRIAGGLRFNHQEFSLAVSYVTFEAGFQNALSIGLGYKF